MIATILPTLYRLAAGSCINSTAGNGAPITSGGASADTNVGGAQATYDTCLPTIQANSDALAKVIQIAFGIIGAIAIIYLMYAAFRFVRSQGEPGEIAQARQTIIYAVIGLAIAVSAEAVVAFALGKL